MPVQEKIPSELEQLLEQAQTRATEAGLHGLPDGFLDTVAPALTVAAARRFGDGGPSLETLRFRADELEAKRRSAEEEAERIRTATARPAPTGDFRWRPREPSGDRIGRGAGIPPIRCFVRPCRGGAAYCQARNRQSAIRLGNGDFAS
jgi:hypothetical protein